MIIPGMKVNVCREQVCNALTGTGRKLGGVIYWFQILLCGADNIKKIYFILSAPEQ